MSSEMIALIFFGGLVILSWLWELFALAINYYWYWHDYRCRQEPWTHEWIRFVKKWWWMVLIKVGPFIGLVLCLLFFSPFALPFWAKITIIVFGVIVVVFYSWLLLHLGGFAAKFKEWLWKTL